jgi:hypothetical protein
VNFPAWPFQARNQFRNRCRRFGRHDLPIRLDTHRPVSIRHRDYAFPAANESIFNLSPSRRGLAVSTDYAYFGLKPEGSPLSRMTDTSFPIEEGNNPDPTKKELGRFGVSANFSAPFAFECSNA